MNITGKAITVALILGVLTIGFFASFSFVTVQGNQIGVKETFTGGVDPNPLPPKTYPICRWTTQIFTYETSGRVYAMNDKDEPFAGGRRIDSLTVNSKDNQQVV